MAENLKITDARDSMQKVDTVIAVKKAENSVL